MVDAAVHFFSALGRSKWNGVIGSHARKSSLPWSGKLIFKNGTPKGDASPSHENDGSSDCSCEETRAVKKIYSRQLHRKFVLLPYVALTLVCRQVAWLGIIILYLHGYTRACNLSCLDPFHSYLLKPKERRKTFGPSWNRTQVLLLHIHKRPL